MKFTSYLWITLRTFLLVLLAPVVTIGYILLVLFVGVPFQIFRKFVSIIAQQLDGDLGKLMTATGSLPGRDYMDWYTEPSHSIVVILTLKGQVTLQSVQRLILRSVVHKWNADREQLEYPELQQYCTKRFGYLFFKWDRQFDISNHVKLYKSREVNDRTVINPEKLMDIWEKIARRPYGEKRSPWEVVYIQNYDPNGNISGPEEYDKLPLDQRHSVLILRSHHSLTDGYSIYRVLISTTDQGTEIWEKEVESMPKRVNSFLLNLRALVCGPTSFTLTFLRGVDYINPLHHQQKKLTGKYHIVQSTLSVKHVKNAKDIHHVSFHSILIAGITGGVRNYLIQNGHNIPMLPVRIGMPIPKPGHTPKLRNEWLSSMINLPVEKKSAKNRLIACQQRLYKIKTGSLLPFLSLSMTLIGGFPVQAIRYLTRKSGITVLYSEMKGPGPLDNVTMFDGSLKVEDLTYSFGLGPDDLGIGFSSMSYKGKIHITLTLDRGIFTTKDKAEQLLSCIVNEIDELQFGDSTNL